MATSHVIVLLALCAIVCGIAVSVKDSPELPTLMSWFKGEYTNYAQWESDVENNVGKKDFHDLIHTAAYHIPFDIQGIGEAGNMVYIQQFSHGDPTKIYRQRIYSFSQDADDIYLDFYTFKNASKYVDAQFHLDIFRSLTPNDVSGLRKCRVTLQWDGEHFSGHTGDSCRVEDPSNNSTILIKDNNIFGKDFFTIHERWFNSKGIQILGTLTPTMCNVTTVPRKFSGYVAVDVDGEAVVFENIILWDAGMSAKIEKKGVSTPYSIELSQVVYGGGFPVFKIAVHKVGYVHKGLTLAIAYAWTQPTATEIGINLRYIEAGFLLAQ